MYNIIVLKKWIQISLLVLFCKCNLFRAPFFKMCSQGYSLLLPADTEVLGSKVNRLIQCLWLSESKKDLGPFFFFHPGLYEHSSKLLLDLWLQTCQVWDIQPNKIHLWSNTIQHMWKLCLTTYLIVFAVSNVVHPNTQNRSNTIW